MPFAASTSLKMTRLRKEAASPVRSCIGRRLGAGRPPVLLLFSDVEYLGRMRLTSDSLELETHGTRGESR